MKGQRKWPRPYALRLRSGVCNLSMFSVHTRKIYDKKPSTISDKVRQYLKSR